MTIAAIMYAVQDIAKTGTLSEQALIRRMITECCNDAYAEGYSSAEELGEECLHPREYTGVSPLSRRSHADPQ